MSLFVVITGPSGVGKTSLCNGLVNRCGITRSVTCTSRAPRSGEVDGKDYHFLSAKTFRQRIQAGDFLEHADVYGNLYGTLSEEILRQVRDGINVLVSVDVQGARSICERAKVLPELCGSVVSLFLMPPSLDALEQRLRSRGQDPDSVIRARLNVAEEEMKFACQCDYVIPADGVENTLDLAVSVIKAERLRSQRVLAPHALRP